MLTTCTGVTRVNEEHKNAVVTFLGFAMYFLLGLSSGWALAAVALAPSVAAGTLAIAAGVSALLALAARAAYFAKAYPPCSKKVLQD